MLRDRHAYIDQKLACRYSEVRPVVRGSGRRITFTSRCQWQRAVSLFCQPGKFNPAAHACTTEKEKKEEEEPIAKLKQREKLRSKGKSCTKTNSCNPKVTVTDESSKEGLRWPVWTGGSRSFAVFEQRKGEFIGNGTNHLMKAMCIGFRNRAFPTGTSWRHQATSPSNRRRSTAGELPAPP